MGGKASSCLQSKQPNTEIKNLLNTEDKEKVTELGTQFIVHIIRIAEGRLNAFAAYGNLNVQHDKLASLVDFGKEVSGVIENKIGLPVYLLSRLGQYFINRSRDQFMSSIKACIQDYESDPKTFQEKIAKIAAEIVYHFEIPLRCIDQNDIRTVADETVNLILCTQPFELSKFVVNSTGNPNTILVQTSNEIVEISLKDFFSGCNILRDGTVFAQKKDSKNVPYRRILPGETTDLMIQKEKPKIVLHLEESDITLLTNNALKKLNPRDIEEIMKNIKTEMDKIKKEILDSLTPQKEKCSEVIEDVQKITFDQHMQQRSNKQLALSLGSNNEIEGFQIGKVSISNTKGGNVHQGLVSANTGLTINNDSRIQEVEMSVAKGDSAIQTAFDFGEKAKAKNVTTNGINLTSNEVQNTEQTALKSGIDSRIGNVTVGDVNIASTNSSGNSFSNQRVIVTGDGTKMGTFTGENITMTS